MLRKIIPRKNISLRRTFSSFRNYDENYAKHLYSSMYDAWSTDKRDYYEDRYNKEITTGLCQPSCCIENTKCIGCVRERDLKIRNEYGEEQKLLNEKCDSKFYYIIGAISVIFISCSILSNSGKH